MYVYKFKQQTVIFLLLGSKPTTCRELNSLLLDEMGNPFNTILFVCLYSTAAKPLRAKESKLVQEVLETLTSSKSSNCNSYLHEESYDVSLLLIYSFGTKSWSYEEAVFSKYSKKVTSVKIKSNAWLCVLQILPQSKHMHVRSVSG